MDLETILISLANKWLIVIVLLHFYYFFVKSFKSFSVIARHFSVKLHDGRNKWLRR